MKFNKRHLVLTLTGVLAAFTLAACGSDSDSLDGKKDTSAASKDSGTIVVGSQDYYSNEIIAEIYAQALEGADIKVERDMRIGQREVYIKDIESGTIDLFPEYTGNLLQYYVKDTKATSSDDVYGELEDSLPNGLRVLDQSGASDQDSYNVTKDFSEKNGVKSLADLKDVDGDLKLGGNSELATRPYGPKGLKSVYGADVAFTPIEDSGGPLTLKALQDGDVQLVNIFSADPKIQANDLVTLEDPDGLFLASNVVPVVSDKVTDDIADIVNEISSQLTAEDLVALNAESVDDKKSAKDIAAGWLKDHPLS